MPVGANVRPRQPVRTLFGLSTGQLSPVRGFSRAAVVLNGLWSVGGIAFGISELSTTPRGRCIRTENRGLRMVPLSAALSDVSAYGC